MTYEIGLLHDIVHYAYSLLQAGEAERLAVSSSVHKKRLSLSLYGFLLYELLLELYSLLPIGSMHLRDCGKKIIAL